MSVPFSFKKSTAHQFPHEISRHVAVTWKSATIIWGGYSENDHTPLPLSDVHIFLSGKWIRKETTGTVPEDSARYHISDDVVQVVNQKMYVLIALSSGERVVYSLDLGTWIWECFSPSGPLPFKLRLRGGLSSWTHEEKTYYFGGKAHIEPNDKNIYKRPPYLELEKYFSLDEFPNAYVVNLLFCYNTCNNTWEWPHIEGDIPSPRFGHKTVISGDIVFLYGGVSGAWAQEHCNDLYILDMTCMRWKQIHGNISSRKSCSVPTLTRISQSAAVLFGFGTSSCWYLDLEKAKQQRDSSSIWTEVQTTFMRLDHAAVLEPVSQKLWVVGGYKRQGDSWTRIRTTSDVLKMSFNHVPLKVLAMDCVAKSININDERLLPDQFPMQLRNELKHM